MENISRISAPTRAKAASYPDILIISRSFHPQEGGIEEYVYSRCLQDPERTIVLAASCTGDRLFDKAQRFPIYRWPIFRLQYDKPGTACAKSERFVENLVQTFLNAVWSFVLAIKLYFRYHYRYIEWGHGYHFLSLLLLSYLLPVRCFIYLHGQDILGLSHHPILRPLFELTLNRVQGIVCSSSHTRDFLATHFNFNAPTHTIKPTVRREKFGEVAPESIKNLRTHLRVGYKIPETAVVILSVGHLSKHQGFDRVIENLTLLLTCGIDVHYIVCGRGSYESELKSLAYRLRVQGRVHFAQCISDRELTSYYAACDLFAMLSSCNNRKLSYFDESCVACLEAGYFGKPAIASNSGSVTDIIYHEDNGILVDPNSGREVFQAFKRLCQDWNLREALGRRGKQLASQKTLHRSLYSSDSYCSSLLT